MNLLICQARHAKREVWGPWEATELHLRVSKCVSGLGEGNLSETMRFPQALRSRYAFLGGIVVEASLDVVFDA